MERAFGPRQFPCCTPESRLRPRTSLSIQNLKWELLPAPFVSARCSSVVWAVSAHPRFGPADFSANGAASFQPGPAAQVSKQKHPKG